MEAHHNWFVWKRWAVGMAVISLIGALQALPAMFSDEPVSFASRVLAWIVTMPLFMLPLFVSFNWASRRRLGSALMLLTSLAVATGSGVVLSILSYFVLHKFPHIVQRVPSYPRMIAFGLILGVVVCAMWALAFIFPFAAEDARLRSMEADKLKLEASTLRSEAELARLRSQLEPHFILNTLNAIAGLTTQDPREARRLIACLGDLLRDSLRDVDEMQTLGEEIAWLRRYAEILEARHAGSLLFHWEIDARAGAALVPRLLLQPLVENAVKHGALRRDEGGQVLVRASVTGSGPEGARLVCAVEDNGPGLQASPPRSGAFGLRAVRRRVELKYPDGSLRLDSSPGRTQAVVDIPYEVAG